MITEEQFRAYLEVRDSGVTNMFDVKKVIQYAEEFNGVILTRDMCIDIMEHFSQYKTKYKIQES
jgi:hypothetical protein